MQLSTNQEDIDKLLMIGDKVLIKPRNPQSQTKAGLYLPSLVQQGGKVQAGYIIETGPEYSLPSQSEKHEVWEKEKGEEVQYLPLQAREGDLTVYLQNAVYEVNFNDERFLITPHSAILMLVRDEGSFEQGLLLGKIGLYSLFYLIFASKTRQAINNSDYNE